MAKNFRPRKNSRQYLSQTKQLKKGNTGEQSEHHQSFIAKRTA
jgi:hypothetical protein